MLSLDVCQSFIADFHAEPLPAMSKREQDLVYMPRKATSLIGVRRCGKTFYLYQIMHDLLEKGIKKSQLLFIDFEDERLGTLTARDLGTFLEAYDSLYPTRDTEPLYLFLDEVQNVQGWERFVRRVQEKEHAQVFVTGSSAKLLSKEIATSLRGRTLTYEIFPFSFREYLSYVGVDAHAKGRVAKAKISHAMADYLRGGGFPESIGQSQPVRQMILQEYLQLMIYKDLIDRHGIQNQKLVKLLIHTLLRNIAAPLSINKLYRDLKSQGYSLAKDTLHLYLSYLEDAYAFFTVELFSESVRAQQVNYRKVYSIDTGFVNANCFGISEKRGQLLENIVFLELRRVAGGRLYYYRTQTQREVDFVLTRGGKVQTLVQVCEGLSSPDTREREFSALKEAMDELDLNRATIVTMHGSEIISAGKKEITVMSVAEFLLAAPVGLSAESG